MRIRINRGFLLSGLGLALFGILCAGLLITAGIFTYYWFAYSRMINERLAGHIDQTTARVYSAPGRISEGEKLSASELMSWLQRAGYNQADVDGAPGWYASKGDAVEVHPEASSFFEGKNALRVEFAGDSIRSIRLLADGATPGSAAIEPELLTNLFDVAREKRRRVRFDDVPPVLVNAVLSAEDKRFFEHPGLDLIRVLGAAWADVRHQGIAQGASTLTMQLARSFFFSTERTWRRKVAETMVAFEL